MIQSFQVDRSAAIVHRRRLSSNVRQKYMITESTKSHLPPNDLIDRLKIAMAEENFEIRQPSTNEIRFRHWGAYFSSSAPSRPRKGEFPKRGRILIPPSENGSEIDYEIEVYGIVKYWMIFIGVVFCELIFPPILINRALSHHPRQLMRNLLRAI